jgi:esterase/lipase superfamily enzyme
MDFVICVRRVKGGKFNPEPAEPGVARFLEVPDGATDILIAHENKKKTEWTKKVLHAAESHKNAKTGQPCGDILLYVHGFNTTTKTMLDRHTKIKTKLALAGFKGVVVSFDWPSDDFALNYLEDRHDAKKTAFLLVKEGLKRFVKYQREGCGINVHILAHSMGAYVVREAFDDADDHSIISLSNWTTSQVMLVSGDISAQALRTGNPKTAALYHHTIRLTNFFNPYDDILKLSKYKRAGLSPRVGRIGLPDPYPRKAVNVDCGEYYNASKDRFTDLKNPSHTWYFEDQKFFDDVMHTITGDIDRDSIPTRRREGGKLILTG